MSVREVIGRCEACPLSTIRLRSGPGKLHRCRAAQIGNDRCRRRGRLRPLDGARRERYDRTLAGNIAADTRKPAFARHGGRLVKLIGDGASIEFASAAEALSAAVAFQQAMAKANRDQPEDRRIVFRIGVHLGDLVVDGSDLYGDGVNVAARLEAEAPAGGIVTSSAVQEAVAGRLKATFEDLGFQPLKNIERPIRAYRVAWEPKEWTVSASTGRPG